MSILEQINTDRFAALKAGDKRKKDTLTFLYAEIQRVGKDLGRETTDPEAVAKIKKYLDNLKDYDALPGISSEQLAINSYEREVYSAYMPKQMTNQEIREIVIALKMQPALEVKHIMAHFKENYAGLYDGKVVSDYAKKPLKELAENDDSAT